MAVVLYATLCDKVCQWLATGRWFSPGTPVSSINKTDRHDITEILLKVALTTITLTHIALKECWVLKSPLSDSADLTWITKQHSLYFNILPWHLLGHAIMSVICFDLQFSRSTRTMTSFCIFIAYINTEGILFNVKITRWD
jgi:hypothetical protein